MFLTSVVLLVVMICFTESAVRATAYWSVQSAIMLSMAPLVEQLVSFYNVESHSLQSCVWLAIERYLIELLSIV